MKIQLHQVLASETLSSIARQYEVSTRQLRNLNGKTKAQLSPGETLFIKVVEDEVLFEEAFHARGLGDEATFITHEVQPKETIYQIAKKYGISEGDLKRSNGLTSNIIGIGSKLRIHLNQKPPTYVPTSNTIAHVVKAKETLYGIAKQHGLQLKELRALNPGVSDTLTIGQTLVVKVQHADQYYPKPQPQPQPQPQPKPQPQPQPQPQLNPTPIQPIPGPTNLPPPITPAGPLTDYKLVPSLGSGSKRYTLELTLPSGSFHKASFQEITTSKGITGMAYNGQSTQFSGMTDQLARLGINSAAVRALLFVSKHEGKFDAVNAYDEGIFSYGFIQFTGSSQNLDKLLWSMYSNAREAYQRIFEPLGIFAQAGGVQVRTNQGTMLSGKEAWNYIRNEFPRLHVPFIQAGFEPSLILEQWRVAHQAFVVAPLESNLSIKLANGQLQGQGLSRLLPMEDIQALTIALAVNLGNGGMRRLMEGVLSSLAQKHRIFELENFTLLSTSEICQHIIELEKAKTDPKTEAQRARIIARTQDILNGRYQGIVG